MEQREQRLEENEVEWDTKEKCLRKWQLREAKVWERADGRRRAGTERKIQKQRAQTDNTCRAETEEKRKDR